MRASPRPIWSGRSGSASIDRPQSRSPLKARTRNIVIAGGVALLLVAIVLANMGRQGGSRTAVQASEVKRGSVASTVRAPGRVQPVTQVKLSANVPGEVIRLAVKEGDVVKKGQVLCIVEAMKLMNEIESELDGRVVKILAESTKPVEYGQPLFLIDPSQS